MVRSPPAAADAPAPLPSGRDPIDSGPGAGAALDPRRWFTLVIVISAALIVVLDNSVLNVAIPTILREFHTTLPSVQWVVTGYALTFASLLIIGGRLGDLYGHRRIFIIGAALFGAGSLLASLSWSVGSLILGEAIIEGIGASLMLPATLAILSTTFSGSERGPAFAVWGATAGAAAALGPVVGGFLTTEYSWRWAFRINVIIAPAAIVGALLVMNKTPRDTERRQIDIPGAALIAAGMFLLVFGLSEGPIYGWLTPTKTFTAGGTTIWPRSAPISMIPVVFLVAALILTGFYRLERSKERADRAPLFEFGQLRHRTFRYGLLTTIVLAMGQLGLLFVLPVFLQDGKHLSAETNGLWVLPTGLFIIVGAQVGGRLTRRIGTTSVARTGLVLETIGLVSIAFAISPRLTFLSLLPGFAFYGVGIGFASSQLTNIVLSAIRKEKAGSASGANTTARQIGSALGVAVIGGLLTAETVRHAVPAVERSSLPAAVKAKASAGLHALGPNFAPPRHTGAHGVAVLRDILDSAVAAGTRPALFFAATVVGAGACLSLLIPQIGGSVEIDDLDEIAEALDGVDA
ncbi:MAG TPA: MFS transporter [Acidimicrobiia bacterium]|nr:MFS transporter [Acidimicrobiia bacterium]